MAIVDHADWALGTTYLAVSRLPWFTALAAWGLGDTYSRGARFAPPGEWDIGPPDHGDVRPLRSLHGLVMTREDDVFAVERRSGWLESPDSPPRGTSLWDDRRAEKVVMTKQQPRGKSVLSVRGGRAAYRGGSADDPMYDVDDELLVDVQWADWTRDGRLLVATTTGHLQVRAGNDTLWDLALDDMAPQPQAPPPEASRW